MLCMLAKTEQGSVFEDFEAGTNSHEPFQRDRFLQLLSWWMAEKAWRQAAKVGCQGGTACPLVVQ